MEFAQLHWRQPDGQERAARDSNPNRQIRRLMLSVCLVGSSWIEAGQVGRVVWPVGF
jgi:hypothetical protein